MYVPGCASPQACTDLPHRPTGGVALALLFFFLNLNPHQKGKTFQQDVSEFDFVGLFLALGGTICILIGFNNSGTSCKWSTDGS